MTELSPKLATQPVGNSELIMRGADKRLSTTLIRGKKTKSWTSTTEKRCWSTGINSWFGPALLTQCWLSLCDVTLSRQVISNAQSESSLSSRSTTVIQLKPLIIQTHLIGLVLEHNHQATLACCPHRRPSWYFIFWCSICNGACIHQSTVVFNKVGQYNSNINC